MSDVHETDVAEGTILGESFKVSAFTWKNHPERGVRFHLYVDGTLHGMNLNAESVVGYMTANLTRALDRMEASDL